MDPLTVFSIATLMMLANGAVLGLLHRDLPPALQPAASSWRISTLLVAGGCVFFAVQRLFPPVFVLPLANGLVMLGCTGYWHALRQFYGYPDAKWLLIPTLAATAGMLWFVAVQPDLGARVVIVSVAWLVIMAGCVQVLCAPQQRDAALSRVVLAGIFIAVMAFVAVRLLYVVLVGVNPAGSVIDKGSWVNAVTPMVVAVLPVIGTTAFLLLCSERIRRQWEQAASTDYLTGLSNRRTLMTAGERRFANARDKPAGMALALIDIDHFKSINDRYGHDVGDLALKHVAAQLVSACREPELPARQGGEEFVVLFEGVDAAHAQAVGERLRRAVADTPFSSGELTLPLTVSIGVAVRTAADHDFDQLLRRADEALYAAKAGGRNRVELALPAAATTTVIA